MRGNKSFADDLIVGQGAVSSRVALLLRSAEAKPSLPRFVETKSLQFVIRSAAQARPSLENDAFDSLWLRLNGRGLQRLLGALGPPPDAVSCGPQASLWLADRFLPCRSLPSPGITN